MKNNILVLSLALSVSLSHQAAMGGDHGVAEKPPVASAAKASPDTCQSKETSKVQLILAVDAMKNEIRAKQEAIEAIDSSLKTNRKILDNKHLIIGGELLVSALGIAVVRRLAKFDKLQNKSFSAASGRIPSSTSGMAAGAFFTPLAIGAYNLNDVVVNTPTLEKELTVAKEILAEKKEVLEKFQKLLTQLK